MLSLVVFAMAFCHNFEKFAANKSLQSLGQEITDYETWSTRTVNRDRPDSLRKRAVSFANHRLTILRAAGYLVKYSGLQPESITLSMLTEPENAMNFIDWRIEQQSRFTASVHQDVAQLIVLAKYLSIINSAAKQRKIFEQRVDELRKYRTTLGVPENVIDKSKRWISLRKLESVGLSIYPLNARRISELRNLLANKNEDATYWREMPSHLRTLERWGDFMGPNRHVSSVTKDDFVFWVAAETERGKENRKPLKKSSIRRGLNTIKAALNHAVGTYPDLKSFQVPRSPLTKKVEEERDRVLSDEEIAQISEALSTKAEWAEALFFFQLDLITGGRMAELLRMRWEESDVRFGTVKLYSSKTKKGAPLKRLPQRL
jgi:integrase